MNDDDQGPLMYGSVAAALFSATVFTAARVYCSVVMLNRTRREDVIIVLSLVGDGPFSMSGRTHLHSVIPTGLHPGILADIRPRYSCGPAAS